MHTSDLCFPPLFSFSFFIHPYTPFPCLFCMPLGQFECMGRVSGHDDSSAPRTVTRILPLVFVCSCPVMRSGTVLQHIWWGFWPPLGYFSSCYPLLPVHGFLLSPFQTEKEYVVVTFSLQIPVAFTNIRAHKIFPQQSLSLGLFSWRQFKNASGP